MFSAEIDLREWQKTPFLDAREMTRVMRDPEYRRSPALRAAVEAKLALDEGNLGISAVQYDSSSAGAPTRTAHKPLIAATGGEDEADDLTDAEKELVARFGPQAVRPAARKALGADGPGFTASEPGGVSRVAGPRDTGRDP